MTFNSTKKKVASIPILFAYLTNFGCSSVREIPTSEIHGSEKILAVVYASGEVVEFQKVIEGGTAPVEGRSALTRKRHAGHTTSRYATLIPDTQTIDGTTADGQAFSIPVGEVHSVRVKRVNMTKTVFVGIGAFILVEALLLAVFATADP